MKKYGFNQERAIRTVHILHKNLREKTLKISRTFWRRFSSNAPTFNTSRSPKPLFLFLVFIKQYTINTPLPSFCPRHTRYYLLVTVMGYASLDSLYEWMNQTLPFSGLLLQFQPSQPRLRHTSEVTEWVSHNLQRCKVTDQLHCSSNNKIMTTTHSLCRFM